MEQLVSEIVNRPEAIGERIEVTRQEPGTGGSSNSQEGLEAKKSVVMKYYMSKYYESLDTRFKVELVVYFIVINITVAFLTYYANTYLPLLLLSLNYGPIKQLIGYFRNQFQVRVYRGYKVDEENGLIFLISLSGNELLLNIQNLELVYFKNGEKLLVDKISGTTYFFYREVNDFKALEEWLMKNMVFIRNVTQSQYFKL